MKLAQEMKGYLSSHSLDSLGPMSKWHHELISNEDNQVINSLKYASNPHEYFPQMLLCSDEASRLTDSNDSCLLRSLQQALRERFESHCIDVEDSLPNGNFFAISFDTS